MWVRVGGAVVMCLCRKHLAHLARSVRTEFGVYITGGTQEDSPGYLEYSILP